MRSGPGGGGGEGGVKKAKADVNRGVCGDSDCMCCGQAKAASGQKQAGTAVASETPQEVDKAWPAPLVAEGRDLQGVVEAVASGRQHSGALRYDGRRTARPRLRRRLSQLLVS